MTRKRHPRTLSEDDLSLWQQVARTARPLKPTTILAKPGHTLPDADPAPIDPPPKQPARTIPAFRVGEAARYDHSKGHNLTPTLEAQLTAQHVQMDRKTFGKMKKGKIRPDRKIDLHGMSLAQAHPALTRFILGAQADGCRLVLVVTGKGKVRDDPGPIPTPRGVLRNQVPSWLSLPPLGSVVLQVTDAHISHGGSGAYYVYLRRHPGRRGR
ncbi:DNA-nicking Smr family endonuclease [Aliiruegeria haliotis]|uniref:DNA-nicking Smr family endonuclease n=1 Tax=Aliiruegeria haliotis TaxID=1280846 RepID=A0A2T0RHR5_9RHOB|nr:Smr/MutS family protein [Aliiruegeria haliotis]PRY20698.1 DNA-nicking Smr family endonuclease [Aliiruegeria haliotis]